ncbi:unnamed protein product [Choristocarpus tenellus]
MPSSQQNVDRVIGVLATVCTGMILVVIGARARTSLSAILRLRIDERPGAKSGRRRSRPSAGKKASYEGDKGDCEDSYHAYVHGSQSGKDVKMLVLHTGSCHCGWLTFEVDAPDNLVAMEGPSKVWLDASFCSTCPLPLFYSPLVSRRTFAIPYQCAHVLYRSNPVLMLCIFDQFTNWICTPLPALVSSTRHTSYLMSIHHNRTGMNALRSS